MCLVDIVQHMWHTGEIPQELGWTFMVLIPKGATNTRGIGLLETLCKVVEDLIDTRICASLHCTTSYTGSGPEEGKGFL